MRLLIPMGQKGTSLSHFPAAHLELSPRAGADALSEVADRSRASMPMRVKRALVMLLESYDYAQDVGCELWEFALEVEHLNPLGLTPSDLRWLHLKGLVEHARELTMPGETKRTFRPGGVLRLCKRTCLVLTEAGQQFARKQTEEIAEPPSLPAQPLYETPPQATALDDHQVDLTQLVPTWDRDRQQLRLGRINVKEFKVPAPNQEAILAAFQEENWPPRIDDPLPPLADMEPKRRLHDTISSLNRNQKVPLIRFLGDGSGEGIRWEHTRQAERNGRG
jgi:hypothetical protein